jgi:FTR1 family protein
VIDSDTSKKAAWGIFAMMFVQVLREGVETFIFLFGATASENAGPNVGVDRSAWKGILVPGFLGLVIGLAVSYVVFRGLVTLDIQSFFLISSVVLMSFAAGLFSRGFHELQELDLFGAYDRRNGLKIESADRGWVNAEMWSTKECCDAEENEFFAMMRALFGYADKPTFLEFSTYFLYWAIILAVLIAINWTVVRAARNRTARYARGCAFFSLISFIVGFIYACLNASWTALLVTFFGLILSIGATLAVFDVLTDSVTALGGVRRMIALACAVGLALFTFFVCVLHLVQMSCLDKRCHLPPFFYWALIFQKGWVEGDNTGTSWHAVGSLAVSFVFSFFFLGGFALVMYLYSGHVGSDGSYIYEDRVKVGENAVADALDDSSPHRSSSDDAAGGRSPGGAPEVAVV